MHLFLFKGVEGAILSFLIDELKKGSKDYISVLETLELISKATKNSPLVDVKTYLLANNIDNHMPIFFRDNYFSYGVDLSEENSVHSSGSFYSTYQALTGDLKGDEYFSIELLDEFEPISKYDIFAYRRGYYYIAKRPIENFSKGDHIVGLSDFVLKALFKKGVIEKVLNEQPIHDDANSLVNPTIDYQKRIAELEQQLANREADSIFVMSNSTVEQAESKANEQVIKELREQLENVQTDNNDLSNRLNTARNTYRHQKNEIDDLKEQLKEANADNDQLSQQVDKLADTAQDHLYDWQAMDKNQYPPELHLTIEVWREYYQADVIKHITQFDTSKFNKIATRHKLINGNLKNRIRTLLTPLERKTKAPQLMKSLKIIDLLHTDKLEQD